MANTISIKSTADGTSPEVQAGGSSDANVDLILTPKGTGKVKFASGQLSGLTASELIATDASKNLVSLAVATYPSLAELAYVKGVTSAIQTQLNNKVDIAGDTMTGALVPADHGTATNPEVVAVVYGTGTPPTASTTPIGTLFIKYTA